MLIIGSCLPLADFVIVRVVGRRDLDAAGAQFGLGPHVGHERNLAVQQRQHQLAAGQRHVAQLHQQRQHVASAGREIVELRLDRLGVLLRCFGQFAAKLLLDLIERRAGSGWTATAVSPSMVSGRVVAMVTCVGSPGRGSMTG